MFDNVRCLPYFCPINSFKKKTTWKTITWKTSSGIWVSVLRL